MKRIGLYSPYFNILGGGERYMLTIAECLAKNYHVDVFWKDSNLLQKAEKKFNLKLNNVDIKSWFFSPITRTSQLRTYDVFFYMTDGSLFFSPSRKNILIIQSPDKIPRASDFFTRIKLKSWSKIICYSEFMAQLIMHALNRNVTSLFVPVDLNSFEAGKKEHYILSVGRFFPYLHSKKYEILISAFGELIKQIPQWQFHIAGSVDPGMEEYVVTLKQKAKGLPIVFHEDVSFRQLQKLYSHASLYWHAAGFGEDPITHPERFEHFGVATIEAMASGCIPLSYKGGGQPEIIQEGENGFLWSTKEELIEKTLRIIKDKKIASIVAINALKRAQNFSEELFCSKVYELVEK